MKKNLILIWALFAIVLVGGSCQTQEQIATTSVTTSTPTVTPSFTPLPTHTTTNTPLPSSTITPSPTPTPIVLFQDDFSDADGGWATQSEFLQVEYQDSSLMISIMPSEQLVASSVSNPEMPEYTDISITGEFTKLRGSDRDFYGFGCRSGRYETYNAGLYLFLISSSGDMYGIAKMKKVKVSDEFMTPYWLDVHGMNAESILQTGGNTTNRLRADCVGNHLALYVNDVKVAEAQDDDFESGSVILFVGREQGDTGNVDVLLDNLVVTEIISKTEPLSSTSKSEEVIYWDDFSDSNSGWVQQQDNKGFMGYDDESESYQIILEQNDVGLWAFAPGLFSYVDTRTEVDVDWVKIGNDSSVNMICRKRYDNSRYQFTITRDGEVSIWKYDGGWRHLDKGVSAWNIDKSPQVHVRFDCVGNDLILYLNDEKVVAAKNASFSVGDVDFLVIGDSGAEVRFDNFMIFHP